MRNFISILNAYRPQPSHRGHGVAKKAGSPDLQAARYRPLGTWRLLAKPRNLRARSPIVAMSAQSDDNWAMLVAIWHIPAIPTAVLRRNEQNGGDCRQIGSIMPLSVPAFDFQSDSQIRD